MTQGSTHMRLVIPSWARHDCVGCGLCCYRGWEIGCTAEERERLCRTSWDDLPIAQPFIPRRGGFRLALQEDGRCVFLDGENRCHIHLRLGPRAKTRTCRTYPFYFHTLANETRVGLHYSCPAVIDQTGRPLAAQRRDLEEIFALDGGTRLSRDTDGTAFDMTRPFSWEHLTVFERDILAICDAPIPTLRRTLAAGRWLDALDAYFTPDMGHADFAELSAHARERALEGAAHDGLARPRLGVFERAVFRELSGVASEMAVSGLQSAHLLRRQRARWERLRLSLAFLFQRGTYQVAGKKGTFAAMAGVSAYPLDAATEAMLTGWQRMRFWTGAYFGSHGFGLGVLHGARFFLSMYGLTLFLARACAATEARRHVEAADVRTALMLTEYCFGHISGIAAKAVSFGMSVINREGWAQRSALCGALPDHI